ncbi:ABC-type multidrug/protein/lipid transport system ATP-binding and permease protein [Candidatus Phytoplasma luffae]|uniref:ABC-type multidrug/protein/lipid transport system ATP-binding and permease protein n=1 Tax=Loofah witches'-broom phytoplasma TaxID=35773 RepID=A0A975IM98_LOWBP|nr:ABC transporter ATP-binding protein [Candidatus Phytoplasma luffae]QTX03292.1 ABC-type multidrug/protein/lipid transport system ATP-binding and permease protein [Candidatus Phytoplasma luffae]
MFSFALIISSELLMPRIVGDCLIGKENSSQNKIIISLIFVVLCIIAGDLLLNFCISKLSSSIFKDLSTDLFKKINTFSISEVENLGVSTIVSRSTYSINQIINFVVTFYKVALCTPIILLVCCLIMWRIHPTLTYGLFCIIVCFIIILIFIIKKNFSLSLRIHQKLEKLNYKIRSDVTGVKIIRSLNKEKIEEKKFEQINSNFTNLVIKLFRSISSIEPFFYILLNISLIATIFLSSDLIYSKKVNIKELYIVTSYNVLVLSYILSFLLLFMMFPKTLTAVSKIQFLFNIQPSIKNNLDKMEKLEKITTLEFQNVYFRHHSNEEFILKNINFTAKESEKIAFVGKTGSGKTTLMNLIPRLIDPSKGVVKINNIDIKNYDLKLLRNKIGFVSQKNILFKGTILSNLLFGKENASQENILDKSKMSQSYEMIQNKMYQLEEPVSELGSNLSGGQKQRLSITRAFLKEPDIYIFDDSFSALDYATDLAIRRSLFEQNTKSITIIVAQRLSSILTVDKIIVLDKGEIVNIGTHQELMEKCSIYKDIAFSQNIK